MKNSFKAMMLSAAVTGLLSGSATPLHASSSHNGAQLGAASSSATMMADKKEKHACKGQNSCKGKGGCATDGSKPPAA